MVAGKRRSEREREKKIYKGNQINRNERSLIHISYERSSFRATRLLDQMNERTVGTSANNIAAGPTAPDLTALTPFPALMTHRAAQLGFRANGTKSSA